MATVTATVNAQIERVRTKLQAIYESTQQLSGQIKKASAEKVQVSRYLYRIPLQQYRGGHLHKYNADGGSLGIGTGMKITALTAGYITTVRSYRVTDEQRQTSESSEQSTVNVFQKTLADAMLEAQIDDDQALHGDGTGKLTNSGSASTATTLTFAGATDTLGINRIREGMVVDVWDTTGATKRAGAAAVPTVIEIIDYATPKVTFSQSITAIANTDLLAISGADIYGPAALTSFSSTWPGGGTTNGPGLTGDSYRHGVYYANDSTLANYYLGKQKSALPQLAASRVNGASSALTYAMGLQLLDLIIQRRDPEATNGLKVFAHMKQRQAIAQIGTTISTWMRGNGPNKMPDLIPSNLTGYDSQFDFCGVPGFVDKRQFNDRLDFINPSLWGRAQTHDIRFKEINGNRVFTVRGADGTMSAEVEFHIENAFDFVCFDPGAQGYIDSLAVPT